MNKSNQYPQVVQDIHNEFNLAGERLLADSLAIIEQSEKQDLRKGELLQAVGFKNAKQSQELKLISEQKEAAKNLADHVVSLKYLYENYKFISTEDVDRINIKYDLIKGQIEQYKGFVPAKNLSDIEAFMNKYRLSPCFEISNVIFGSRYQNKVQSEFLNKLKKQNNKLKLSDFPWGYGINRYLEFRFIDKHVNLESYNKVEVSPFEICAPKSEMIDLSIWDKMKSKLSVKVEVPDPIVLYPVEHGYIIVTAWGDEASDPLVLNEKLN